MSEKSKDPDIYKIDRELFHEEVDRITSSIIGDLQHDHGGVVRSWGEGVIYVLASLLEEALYPQFQPEYSNSFWLNLYPETKNILIALSNGISYKLGIHYFPEEKKKEFLSKLEEDHKSFKKVQDEVFISDAAKMILNESISTQEYDDKYQKIKEILKLMDLSQSC